MPAAPAAPVDGHFRKGDIVNIINMTMGGRFLVEGRARIVRSVRDVDGQYVVRFEGDFGNVERFVDPQAQGEDVASYVERLNASAAEAR